MLRRALVLAMVLAGSTGAAADQLKKYVQTEAPRLLCIPPAPSEKCIELPPGRFVDAASWSKLDVEMRRLQDAETRLAAQNKSLRVAVDGWSPGWRTLGAALLTGFTAGAATAHYLR